jgi:hypothetical protein
MISLYALAWCLVGMCALWFVAIKTGDTITIGDLCIIVPYGCVLGPIALLCMLWLFGRRLRWPDVVIYRKNRSE